MQWVWIRSRLRLAERHLDRAVSASAAKVMRVHLQRAQDAYAAAMSALEEAGLSGDQQRELTQRMQQLSVRLRTIEQRHVSVSGGKET